MTPASVTLQPAPEDSGKVSLEEPSRRWYLSFFGAPCIATEQRRALIVFVAFCPAGVELLSVCVNAILPIGSSLPVSPNVCPVPRTIPLPVHSYLHNAHMHSQHKSQSRSWPLLTPDMCLTHTLVWIPTRLHRYLGERDPVYICCIGSRCFTVCFPIFHGEEKIIFLRILSIM